MAAKVQGQNVKWPTVQDGEGAAAVAAAAARDEFSPAELGRRGAAAAGDGSSLDGAGVRRRERAGDSPTLAERRRRRIAGVPGVLLAPLPDPSSEPASSLPAFDALRARDERRPWSAPSEIRSAIGTGDPPIEKRRRPMAPNTERPRDERRLPLAFISS